VTVNLPFPGRDEIILTAPGSARLCNSLACARAGRAADVIATFGTLNDAGAAYYDRAGLWREQWGRSYPLCGGCCEQTRQVAAKYRPRLVVTDTTQDGPAAAARQPSGGRA
jgi:hypothetical protein